PYDFTIPLTFSISFLLLSIFISCLRSLTLLQTTATRNPSSQPVLSRRRIQYLYPAGPTLLSSSHHMPNLVLVFVMKKLINYLSTLHSLPFSPFFTLSVSYLQPISPFRISTSIGLSNFVVLELGIGGVDLNCSLLSTHF
uniref:Uncharacterized protein n=1 Tax=Cucumis melo TaxID=3656 RepID=A0A9I9EC65_CUCME